MTSTTLRWLAGLLLVHALIARGAAAQEPPKFLIESIRVTGTQRAAARQIVADESLLKPGQMYSEPELRQAVYRIKRLSFIIDADFSLEKGSERGAYELVITIEEQKPLFFLAQADAFRSRRAAIDRVFYATTWQESGSLGGRYFVGSHGIVFGSVGKSKGVNGEILQAGYTQYDVFGRGSFASLQVATQQGVRDHDNDQASLAAGIPLSSTQSLRTDFSWSRQEDIDRITFDIGQGPVTERSESRSDAKLAQLTWIYDTTDDPLFSTSGTRVSAGAQYSHYQARTQLFSPYGNFDNSDSGHRSQVFVSGTHYVPLTPRQSLILALDNTYAWSSFSYQGPDTDQIYQAVGGIGYSLSLLGLANTERFGDLRFESGISATYTDLSNASFSGSGTTASFQSALIYRNPWGLIRLSFTYYNLWSNL
jgi:hemolysin activation/secretion protein